MNVRDSKYYANEIMKRFDDSIDNQLLGHTT